MPVPLGTVASPAYAAAMLPDALLSRLSPARAKLLGELLRFGIVGTLGFLVDSGTLYLALGLGAGLYGGRVISYVTAATANWALNRAWTFRQADRDRPGRQWLKFLAVNLLGFAVNYGTYVVLIGRWPLAEAHPVIAVALGSIAGLAGNFLLSRNFVFTASK